MGSYWNLLGSVTQYTYFGSSWLVSYQLKHTCFVLLRNSTSSNYKKRNESVWGGEGEEEGRGGKILRVSRHHPGIASVCFFVWFCFVLF